MLRKTYRFRLLLLGAGSVLVFAAILVRLYHIQIIDHEKYLARAAEQQHKRVTLTPRRGDILDRNGSILATSYFTDTVVLDTRKLRKTPGEDATATAPDGLIADLAEVLGKPQAQVERYFEKPYRYYVYRKAPEEVSQAMALIDERHDLPRGTIVFEKQSKRYYPKSNLASHVLGFTKIDDAGDNIGLAGVELQYDEFLKGSYQETDIPVNSLQSGLAPIADEVIESTYGNNLVLTIDEQIQMFTQRALRRRVGQLQARSGIAVVMDVRTGGLLALANCPDFDPNSFSDTDQAQRLNRALTDPIEVGSVMKILTATLLFDNGLLSPYENVNTTTGYVVLHGRGIKDSHPIGGWVPLRRAFAESSNVAMALLSERIEPEPYYQGLRRFGLGSALGIDLPGEGTGILRPTERWTAMSRASLAIGYETSLTPLQAVTALAAIGNNGWRMRPHVVKAIVARDGRTVRDFPGEPVERVASPEVCAQLLELMEAVVLEGTGKNKADIPGYRVGGKTGTTVKHYLSESGRKLYIASFAGLFPIDDPRVAVFITIDEPRGMKYGGEVSAPVFREIAMKVAHILGIPPNDPAAYEEFRRQKEAAELPALLVAEDGGTSVPIEEKALFAEADAAPAIPDASVDPFDPAKPILPLDDFALAESLADPPAAAGEEVAMVSMPDCRGLNMLDAWDRLAEAGIEARMVGSGVAVRQDPEPGRRVPATRAALVVFAQQTERGEKSGAAPVSARAQ